MLRESNARFKYDSIPDNNCILYNIPSIIIVNSNIKPGTNIITRIKRVVSRVRYTFNSCMFWGSVE